MGFPIAWAGWGVSCSMVPGMCPNLLSSALPLGFNTCLSSSSCFPLLLSASMEKGLASSVLQVTLVRWWL